MEAYPIKFSPILKEKIWGGEKLSRVLNKNTTLKNVGESWEISGVEGNISIVSNGLYKGKSLNDLIKKFKSEFLGDKIIEAFGENFPLLIKFLDAKTNLSVQVHPDDKMAKEYHNSFGKTEMWYIMDSDENAEIVLGLKNTNTRLLESINADNVTEVFNKEKVKQGDSYFIPAGKIHAIGAGVLAAEIQQTSDITYRVYDWDREDDKGQRRELHTDMAKKATKVFKSNGKCKYNLNKQNTSNLVDCDFFTTNIFNVKGLKQRDYTTNESFVIYMCVEGKTQVTINGYTEFIAKGETILVPANCESVVFNAQNAKLLEVYIKPSDSDTKKIAS